MEQESSNSQNEAGRRPLRLLACSGSLDGGGSERQLWQLVSRLDRRRFASEVYLLHKRGPYLEQLPGDVPVHAFDSDHPAPFRFPPGRISRMQARHLREVVQSRSIDVVYDRTYHMNLLTGWALPATQPRISVIVSPPSRDVPRSERRFVWIKRKLLARSYRTATASICVSTEVADDAAKFYHLPRERFTVLHNPVDIETVRRMAKGLEFSRENFGGDQATDASSGHLHMALVGRYTAEKGHRFVLDVLRALRERPENRDTRVHLHCVGDGPLKSEIQMLIAQWGLSSVVHQHGYRTNPYPFMAGADLVIVPSRYEGFPNVAMEAMALGVPLLMTDYGPTARLIAGPQAERARLIPLDDVQQAVQSIIDRRIDAAPWLARAAAAKHWIEREHALVPWLDKMMILLESAVSSSPRRAGP